MAQSVRQKLERREHAETKGEAVLTKEKASIFAGSLLPSPVRRALLAIRRAQPRALLPG